MDPLVCAGGRRGHALLIDFSTLATEHVRIPPDVEIVVVDSGQRRTLRTSEYAARVLECEAAAAVIGPLGSADEDDIVGLRDAALAQAGPPRGLRMPPRAPVCGRLPRR